MKKGFIKKEFKAILVSVLVISIIFNIYSVYKINDYKYKIEQQAFNYIDDIRQRNESNMEILSKSLKDNNIKNEELLKLYKNYDTIASDIIGLWQRYSSYESSTINVVIKKNINTNKAIENEIHGFIKEYILATLNNEMKNEKNKLVLEGDDRVCFDAMYNMSVKIYNYFNEFNQNTLYGASGEIREKKIIKNHYWIDMLEGIYAISEEYINIQWKIEMEVQ